MNCDHAATTAEKIGLCSEKPERQVPCVSGTYYAFWCLSLAAKALALRQTRWALTVPAASPSHASVFSFISGLVAYFCKTADLPQE